MNKIFLLLCFVLLSILPGCKKDKQVIDETPPVPSVRAIEILEPTYPTEGGINLGLKVNSVPEEVYNFGIMIFKDSTLREIITSKNIESPLQVKSYHINIKSGLKLDSVYYYSYYLNNKVNKNKDDILKFTFGKELKLKIDSISSNSRFVGDTLRLYGDFEGFQLKEAGIGNVKLQAYKYSDKVIYMLLSDKTPIGEQSIYLHSTYQKTIFKDKFSLHTASITDFPKEVQILEEVSIKGSNFSAYPKGNKLFINDEEVSITSSTPNLLKFTIPNTIKSATLHLKLQSNNQTIVTKDLVPMRIKKPTLVKLPSEISINDLFSLSLKDLPKTALKLVFDGHEASLFSRSDDERDHISDLYWEIGIANYLNKTAQLELQYLDEKIKFSPLVKINAPWFVASNEIPFDVADLTNPAVVVNNTAYILAGSNTSKSGLSFWKFNKISGNFSEMQVPFTCEYPVVTASKDKIYLYTGGNTDNFYELDPVNNTYKHLENYSGKTRLNGTMNAVNGKIYMVTGHNYAPDYPYGRSEGDGTMYAYDVANNKWNRSVDFPEIEAANVYGRMRTSSFVIKNKLFVVGGSLHTGQTQTYAFDTGTNQWTTTADVPPMTNRSSIGIGDNGYLLYPPFYRYKSATNKWEEIPHILPRGYDTSHSIAFVLDDQFYYRLNSFNKLLRISVNELTK